MTVINTILGALRGAGPVTLDEAPAAGEAQAATSALITDLRTTQPKELRGESTAQYLEAVIDGDRLEEYSQILTKAFGEPCKPFGVRAEFTPALAKMIDTMGGVMKTQCLYLRRYADNRIAFAALWPWGNPSSITLKVGILG